MAIQKFGQISLNDIANEFGYSSESPININDYYRNGDFVPDDIDVPIDGMISLSDFYGASNSVFDLLTTPYSIITMDLSSKYLSDVFQDVTVSVFNELDGQMLSSPIIRLSINDKIIKQFYVGDFDLDEETLIKQKVLLHL